METLAALGLAANIFQFVQYGTDFVAQAYKIHQAGTEGLAEVGDLRVISKDLRRCLNDLQTQVLPKSGTAPGSQAQLSQSCMGVLDQLVHSLDKIGVPEKGRKWEAVITAFKVAWKKDDIVRLEQRIQAFREQLVMDMMVTLRDFAMKSVDQQRAILKRLDVIQDKSEAMASLTAAPEIPRGPVPGEAMTNYVTRQLDPTKRLAEETALKVDLMKMMNRTLGDVQTPTAFQISKFQKEQLQGSILATLYYSGMEDRKQRISEAHEKTFRWLFEREGSNMAKWTNLVTWLESDSSLYWITGKAGSGKSTLMKFLTEYRASEDYSKPPAVEEHLKVWAGERKLAMASFYFWASGKAMQASKDGLHKSLLSQLFKAYPDIIPKVVPHWWEALCFFDEYPEKPTDGELLDMFYTTVKAITEDHSLCLFIDGLDEFAGDPQILIDLVHGLLKTPNLKICVSSRPWVVFEDAFSNRPNLRLQDLSYPDIKAYVTSMFGNDAGFQRLRDRDSDYAETLMDNVVEKASGVFLWVQVVVKSLLAGMRHDDRLSDLQRKLDLLPPDLEQLYDAILRTVDPFYFEHAAQFFTLVGESDEPLEVLLFSYADEEDDRFAINHKIEAISDKEHASRKELVHRRLNSRCKGLLEISDTSQVSPTIEYLHRTVREFIMNPDVKATFKQAVGDFDPHLRLCSAYLAYAKTMRLLPTGRSHCGTYFDIQSPLFSQQVRKCLKEGNMVSRKSKGLMLDMTDNLRAAIETLGSPGSVAQFYRSTGIHASNYSVLSEIYCGSNFVSLAVRTGGSEYVKIQAPDDCVVWEASNGGEQEGKGHRKGKPHPLLFDAIFCKNYYEDLLKCLFNLGADPNFVLPGGQTVWTETLSVFINLCPARQATYGPDLVKREWTRWITILKVFVENGAAVDRKVDDAVSEIALRQAGKLVGFDKRRFISGLRNLAEGKDDYAFESMRWLKAEGEAVEEEEPVAADGVESTIETQDAPTDPNSNPSQGSGAPKINVAAEGSEQSGSEDPLSEDAASSKEDSGEESQRQDSQKPRPFGKYLSVVRRIKKKKSPSK